MGKASSIFGRLLKPRETGLKELNLSGNGLADIPTWIGELQGLTKLNWSENGLTKLPDWIGELQDLTVLDLRSNELTQLPESISQLKQLEILDVRDNKLTQLPESISQLKQLEILDVRDNPLTQLPDWIGQMESLTTFKSSVKPLEKPPSENVKRLSPPGGDLPSKNGNTPPPAVKDQQQDNGNTSPPPVKDQPQDNGNTLPLPEPEKKSKKEIFISYAQRSESAKIADQLDEAFQESGITIFRDTRDLRYKESIEDFRKKIGMGKCVIVVISKKYLESENCMVELVEVARNGDFNERVFPIFLDDAKIFDPIERIKYVQYWTKKIQELELTMKGVPQPIWETYQEEIDQYTEIRDTIALLTDRLTDMYVPTAKMLSVSGFAALIDAVEKRLAE